MFKRNAVETGKGDKRHCYAFSLWSIILPVALLLRSGDSWEVDLCSGVVRVEVSECVFCASVFRMD